MYFVKIYLNEKEGKYILLCFKSFINKISEYCLFLYCINFDLYLL